MVRTLHKDRDTAGDIRGAQGPGLQPGARRVLRGFVTAFARLLDETSDEALILKEGGVLLANLVSADDWLPDAYAQPDPTGYRQHLLHCDSRERRSGKASGNASGQPRAA